MLYLPQQALKSLAAREASQLENYLISVPSGTLSPANQYQALCSWPHEALLLHKWPNERPLCFRALSFQNSSLLHALKGYSLSGFGKKVLIILRGRNYPKSDCEAKAPRACLCMQAPVLINKEWKANPEPSEAVQGWRAGLCLCITCRAVSFIWIDESQEFPSENGLMHHDLHGWEVSKQGKAKLLGLMPLPVYFCRRCYLPGHLPGVLSHGFEQPWETQKEEPAFQPFLQIAPSLPPSAKTFCWKVKLWAPGAQTGRNVWAALRLSRAELSCWRKIFSVQTRFC